MWMFSSFTLLSWDHSACSGGLTCPCPPTDLLIPCLDSWLPIVLGKASPHHMVNLLIPAWASIPHQGCPCSWPCSSPSWALTHMSLHGTLTSFHLCFNICRPGCLVCECPSHPAGVLAPHSSLLPLSGCLPHPLEFDTILPGYTSAGMSSYPVTSDISCHIAPLWGHFPLLCPCNSFRTKLFRKSRGKVREGEAFKYFLKDKNGYC